MRQISLLLCALFLATCGVQRPIQEHITIEFGEKDTVLVSVETTYDPSGQPRSIAQRVEAARSSALADRDEWSVRFARVTPDAEQTIFERRKGLLERSSRHARIPSDDLPRVFSDLPLTLQTSRWERGRELTIYPGVSTRATREQRENFARNVDVWSKAVARYFTSVNQLYSYLEEESPRAPYVFAALFGEKAIDGVPVGVTDREQPLLDGVTGAMSEILDRMDADERQQFTLIEEADLIFNPFPGRVTVKVPGDITALESFQKTTERDVTIEPIDLLRAVTTLEGKWISPDPLALLLQAERAGSELPTGAQVATIPRRSTPVVSAGEIERAVLDQLRRSSTYRVRWVD